MKNKELIKKLQDLDPELEVITRIDKYYTHKPVINVELVVLDISGAVSSEEDCDEFTSNAIALND